MRRRVLMQKSSIIHIDRSKPFDERKFLESPAWSVVRQNRHSLTLTKVDLSKVVFGTVFGPGRTKGRPGESTERFKTSKRLHLDAKVFETLWYNQHLIPKEWKSKIDGSAIRIFFTGTIIQSPLGGHCVIQLYWEQGQWRHGVYWVNGDWCSPEVSESVDCLRQAIMRQALGS